MSGFESAKFNVKLPNSHSIRTNPFASKATGSKKGPKKSSKLSDKERGETGIERERARESKESAHGGSCVLPYIIAQHAETQHMD